MRLPRPLLLALWESIFRAGPTPEPLTVWIVFEIRGDECTYGACVTFGSPSPEFDEDAWAMAQQHFEAQGAG